MHTHNCQACRRPAETLHMRDSDGKWVCKNCIPAKEMKKLEEARKG